MNQDEKEIRELVAAWMEATKQGDIQTVLDLMTEDAVFLLPGRPPMIGRAAFEAASRPQSPPSGPSPQIEGVSDIQEIQILGDWAFMWTHLKVEVTAPGKTTPLVRAGHTLSILKKQEGRWRLARDANMLSAV